MNFADKMKQAAQQAKEAAAGHKEQVESAIDKAAQVADQRTGGKYTDKIQKAEAKADKYVQKLKPEDGGAENPGPGTPPPAGPTPVTPAPTEPPFGG